MCKTEWPTNNHSLSLFVYVHEYVGICVCVRQGDRRIPVIKICVTRSICVYVGICVGVRQDAKKRVICMCVHVYTQHDTHIHVESLRQKGLYVCVFVCLHIYIYIYIWTLSTYILYAMYIYIYIHTYIHVFLVYAYWSLTHIKISTNRDTRVKCFICYARVPSNASDFLYKCVYYVVCMHSHFRGTCVFMSQLGFKCNKEEHAAVHTHTQTNLTYTCRYYIEYMHTTYIRFRGSPHSSKSHVSCTPSRLEFQLHIACGGSDRLTISWVTMIHIQLCWCRTRRARALIHIQ